MLKDCPIVPYIPVTDLGRARTFYEEVVGLVPMQESPNGVAYAAGNGSWVFMYLSGNAGTSKASQAFWQVTDLTAEMAELRARGLRFEEYDFPELKTVDGVFTGGGARTAWFKDSEGNTMALVQTLPAPRDK